MLGEIIEHDVKILELAALKGVFADVVEETVSYVNAPLFATDRGIEVSLRTDPESPQYRNVVTGPRHAQPTAQRSSVAGTLTGPRDVERIVEVDGYDVDVPLERAHGVLPLRRQAGRRRRRRPGARRRRHQHRRHAGRRAAEGGQALIALTVDSAIPAEVLAAITTEIGATSGRTVDLPV